VKPPTSMPPHRLQPQTGAAHPVFLASSAGATRDGAIRQLLEGPHQRRTVRELGRPLANQRSPASCSRRALDSLIQLRGGSMPLEGTGWQPAPQLWRIWIWCSMATSARKTGPGARATSFDLLRRCGCGYLPPGFQELLPARPISGGGDLATDSPSFSFLGLGLIGNQRSGPYAPLA